MHRVVPAAERSIRCDGLVGDHAAGPVGGRGIDPMRTQIGFGARDEEGASLVRRMEAGEVDIPAIHHADGAGFGAQHVQRMNIVQLAVRDMDAAWNVAAQIEPRVHLDGGFGGPEMSPGGTPTGTNRWSWNPAHRRC